MRTPGVSGSLLPAIRDPAGFQLALELGYRQVILERGSLLGMVGALAAASRRGIAIFVNLDGVEGLALDSAALAFLATDLGFSGVVSVRPSILRDASRFRLRTVQRIHALDSTGFETGLRSIASPKPAAIAIAPALAVPQVMSSLRDATDASVWGTGFVTSVAHAQTVLDAGAEVVSSARPDVWEAFRPT